MPKMHLSDNFPNVILSIPMAAHLPGSCAPTSYLSANFFWWCIIISAVASRKQKTCLCVLEIFFDFMQNLLLFFPLSSVFILLCFMKFLS